MCIIRKPKYAKVMCNGPYDLHHASVSKPDKHISALNTPGAARRGQEEPQSLFTKHEDSFFQERAPLCSSGRMLAIIAPESKHT